ncbi:NAD(P)H-dependent flavin oxidoreductase [candidate division KSB1 bacterium]
MKLSEKLFRRGSEFLGVKYPILCGAMTWISNPPLIAAVSNAGGFASLAGGNTPTGLFEDQINETRELTDKPFGINLITIAPLYQEHLEMVCDNKVPLVVFAGSFPRKKEVLKVKETGAKVLCFASTKSIAERMLNYGADGLILEGMEAGGHVGYVSLTILLQQVLFEISDKVPVFAAGGIATGRMCAHLMIMGAAGVQLGTKFAAAVESCAHPKFKDAFIRANARDAIANPQIDSRLPVVPVRALRNKGQEDFKKLQFDLIRKMDNGEISRAAAQLEVEEFWMGALRKAVVEGDVSYGSLMSGQSVGLIDKIQTIREIMDELVSDTEAELHRVHKLFHD